MDSLQGKVFSEHLGLINFNTPILPVTAFPESAVYFHATFIIIITSFLRCHVFCDIIVIFPYFVDVLDRKVRTDYQLIHSHTSLSNNTDGLIISTGL